MTRFRILHVLIGTAFIAGYCGLRLRASATFDQRILWIVAPALSSAALSVTVAAQKRKYLLICFAAVIGAFAPLLVWLLEVWLESDFANQFGLPSGLGTLLLYSLALTGPISVLGFLVGALVRYAFDDRITVASRRLGLSVAIVFSAGVCSFAFERWHDPSFRYRVLGESSSFRAALTEHIRPGMTMEEVQAYLGPPVHEKDQSWIQIQIDSAGGLSSIRYPDGIKRSDRAIAYSGWTQWTLWFRDGKLINYTVPG